MKRAQEIADGSPHAFRCVGVNFVDAIAIIIACPFSLSMTHCSIWSKDVVVASPFVRKDLGSDL
jgi:hypothetical protein